MKILFLLIAFYVCAAVPAGATVTVSKLFSSHMVLQRDMPIHIWGLADAGEQINVSLDTSNASVKTNSIGQWSIYLPAHRAGGPYTLSIRAANTLQFDDIMMGDLWVASGQSNMELPLQGYDPKTQIDNGPEEIANAKYAQIRLFLIKHDSSDYPLQDFKAVDGWSQCTPSTAAAFSAVA